MPLSPNLPSALLAQFPDPDPTRPFVAAECTLALAESGATPRGPTLELSRDAMFTQERLFQRRSFWDALLAAAAAGPLHYHSVPRIRITAIYIGSSDLTGDLRAQNIGCGRIAPSASHISDIRPAPAGPGSAYSVRLPSCVTAKSKTSAGASS